VFVERTDAGQDQEIKIGNRSFENVAQFIYLRIRVTNRNLIQKDIKKKFTSGNAGYHLD
jgi:hypothetical protein